MLTSWPEIKQEPNKSGGGEEQWAAWKVYHSSPLTLSYHGFKFARNIGLSDQLTDSIGSEIGKGIREAGRRL